MRTEGTPIQMNGAAVPVTGAVAGRWPVWLLFGAIWVVAYANLSVHWLANPIYIYGWAVPALALLTAFWRWRTRPAPSQPLAAGRALILISAAAFFPTWLFAQPNPDWALVSWLVTAEVVALTLGAVALAGGWNWARHFAFPICFIFTAVPCPHVIEIPLTIGMMQRVAAVTVELLNVAGIAAVQQGNVIEVRTGLLGVDEACSGVRSLQATFMLSIFLGELFRFGWKRRVMLVGVGLLAAVATNVARTFLLAWKASESGLDSVKSWHDPAGYMILSACFVIVWGVGSYFGRNDPTLPATPNLSRATPLPKRLVAGLAAWMIGVVVAVEAWFYDPERPPENPWTVLPMRGSEPVEFRPETLAQLQCDTAGGWSWRTNDGGQWLVYSLSWAPGPIRSRVLARVHRPDICLSAVGLKLIADRGTLTAEASGFELPFRAYTFEQGGRLLYVYYGLWQNRSLRARNKGELSHSEHIAGIQAVKWRERHLGQHVAEFAAAGYPTATEADTAFREVVRNLVIRRPL